MARAGIEEEVDTTSSRPKKPRRNRLVGQFLWVSTGRLVAALLQALALVLVARAVSPAEFGVLSAFLGIATVAQTAIDLGVSTFIIRERAANPTSGRIAVALRLNWVTSAALMVITGAVLVALGITLNSQFLLVLPLAIWIGMERNADARLSIVLADGDAKINVANLLARRTAAVGLFVAAERTGLDPLLAFTLATALAAAGSSVFANLYVRRRVSPASDDSFRHIVRNSYPYWVHSLATQARNLDVPLVGVFAGAAQAGFYSSGSRLTNPLRILPYSLANVLMPEATRRHKVGGSFRGLLLLSAVMVAAVSVLYAVIFILTPWFTTWALGPEYLPAIPTIQIVVAGLPFAAAVSLLHALLQSLGRKHLVATTSTMFAIALLVSVSILAALYGANGAAIALSATVACQSIYLSVWLTVALRRRNHDPGNEIKP